MEQKRNKRIIRNTLGVLLLVGSLFFLTVFILAQVRKDLVKNEITSFLSQKVDGEFHLGALQYSYFSNFPLLKIRFEDIAVKQDSTELLKADLLEIGINPLRLIWGTMDVKRVNVKGAYLALVVDSTGNKIQPFLTNNSGTHKKGSIKPLKLSHIGVEDTRLFFSNGVKNNRSYIYIQKGELKLEPKDSLLVLRGHLNGALDSLISNNTLLFKNQPVRGENVEFHINRTTREKSLVHGDLYTHGVKLTAEVHMKPHLDGQKIRLRIGSEDNFDALLNLFELSSQLDLEQVNPDARLSIEYNQEGFVNPMVRPYSELDFFVADAEFVADYLPFPVHVVDIKGNYNNGTGHSPETVELVLDTMHAKVQGSSVRARFVMTNLKDPVIDAHFLANMDLSHISPANQSIQLKGDVVADLRLDGRIRDLREMHIQGQQSAKGSIQVTDLEVIFQDQGFKVELKNGASLLDNHILEVTSLMGAFNESAFNFKGKFENIDHLLSEQHNNIIGTFNLNFSELDISTISMPAPVEKKKDPSSFAMLEGLFFDIHIHGDKIITPYGPLENIELNCRLDSNALQLKKLIFDYQEGSLSGIGTVAFDRQGITRVDGSLTGAFESLELDLRKEEQPVEPKATKGFVLPDFLHTSLDLKVVKGSINSLEFADLDIQTTLDGHTLGLQRFDVDAFDGHSSLIGRIVFDSLGIHDAVLSGEVDLERLDLNDLAGSQKGKNSPTLTLPDRLNVDIVLAVSELIYKDARVEHVQTHIKAKNERFELDRLQAALPFGRLSASLQTTREKGAFHQFTGSVSLDLDTLDVDGLLKMEVFTSSNNTAGNQQKKQFGIPANNNIEVQVMADEIRYRDLVLDNLEMVSGIEGQQLEVETLKLNFAGGDMELKARLEPDNNDQFSGYLYAKGNEIEIEQVFSSFNNFNQDAFTADNSSGEVSLAAHIYFMLNEDGALVRDENFSLMNLQVHNAEFDRVEPIEKTLFFVGHKTKDKMKVHQLNLNAYLVGEELIFRDVYMNDNIADLGLFGIIDVEEKAMDLGLEISLTDLFFRSKQRRMENKDQGLYSLEKDSKLFLHLYGPLADHKIRKISNRKFTNYWEALNADIKSAVQSMRQKQAELSD